MKADGSGWEFLHQKAGGSLNPATIETVQNKQHFVYQEGKSVFKRAVMGMSETIKDVLNRNNLTIEDVDWVVPHQANKRIISSVSAQLDCPEEKVLVNIENYGNTTAGTIPLVLRDFESKFKKGDRIVLTAFGGGFTWGSILLEWMH